ncbi:hypothetical protein LV89_02002 [Arcicella aurantiaca]|uniref:Uncharacterized protein n=1 Tax=Arcicella aurantiaca TaxID=591202 RepID=A0A316E9W7_9BACT|nr:hypothetical protein [Arcicella aurantiaca]PWK27187.1 hypothetical protein LV89_02002 [Arcicella aurantiaca]
MAANKSIAPKIGSQKRPVNPEAKLAGFKLACYLQLFSSILTFPDRAELTALMTDEDYVTAVTGATANKPFGATTFAKCEVVKDSIKLNAEGDFSKGNTAVKSTAEVVFYADKGSRGFAAKLKGADVIVVLPKYNGQMLLMGDKDVPAVVTKYKYEDGPEVATVTLTVEFEPYEVLSLADGSILDLVA